MTTKRQSFGLKDLESRFGPLTLGRFLRSWRLSAEVSQKDFAARLGISPANLCDLEKERKGISIRKAAEIAKILGYSPEVLVQLTVQEQLAATGLKLTVEVRKSVA